MPRGRRPARGALVSAADSPHRLRRRSSGCARDTAQLHTEAKDRIIIAEIVDLTPEHMALLDRHFGSAEVVRRTRIAAGRDPEDGRCR